MKKKININSMKKKLIYQKKIIIYVIYIRKMKIKLKRNS